MNDTAREMLGFIGVTAWRNAGFDGRGIKVWVTEPITGSHGANTAAVLRDTAPGCTVIGESINRTTPNQNQITNVNVNGEPLRDFIRREQPDILTASLHGSGRNTAWSAMMAQLQREFNFTMFNSAGNDGNSDNGVDNTIRTSLPKELCLVIGALQWSNGSPRRAGFSAAGEYLDFMQVQLWWSGTSAATPVMAGMGAMVMQRYGKMSQEELFKYFRFNAHELPSDNIPGHDRWYGWGHVRLPAVRRRYITMTTNSNMYHVDGVAHTMDTRPVNRNDRVFVPVRAVAHALGIPDRDIIPTPIRNGVVNVVIRRNGVTIDLTTGNDVMFINGRRVYLDVAPFIDKNNRTLVPIRAIAEAFNCQVDWVQSEAKVMILES